MRRKCFSAFVCLILLLLLTDLDIIANVVAGEAMSCPLDHQIAVASVVLNRVADPRFPSSVAEVVGQEGQYSETYLTGQAPESCYKAAEIAYNGESDVPSNVIYQANFPQGSAIWWRSDVDTGYWQSTTYFCEG